ncbi:MAG: (S)-ureidoglycine aminohydrolase [Neomegalonema sp.]|nr:(S)-ureidoglycine aminohydrolase [Neomegalonema sp.]
MSQRTYYAPKGGLPPQSQLTTDRAVFTDAYAVLPRGVLSDIVTSRLPYWEKTRAWVLARPLSGFAETFSQYIVETEPGGGSKRPEPQEGAEGAFFVMEGDIELSVDGVAHLLTPGGFAYVPPGLDYSMIAIGDKPAKFHWFRKLYEPLDGLAPPDFFTAQEADVAPTPMANTDAWATTLFVSPDDMRHDMHITIVTFEPGGAIPFAETHVMEHGLYMLEGKAVYLLNRDWVEVQEGDFLWLRAFCPQACYAGGPGKFRYLLYKDVNRHAQLR